MIYPAAALRVMLIERVAGFPWWRGGQVWEDAVDDQSGCPTTCFGVQGFEYRRRPGEFKYIDGSCTLEVAVGANHPGRCCGLSPYQPSARDHMLKIDQQRCRGRARPFLAVHPP